MTPELNKQNLQAVQNTIGNMLMKVEIRPKEMEGLFDRLEKSSEQAAGVEQALMETKRSMNQLMDQRGKLIGSIDTLTDIIAEQITDEQVKQYGVQMQPLKPTQEKDKNELPIKKTAQG